MNRMEPGMRAVQAAYDEAEDNLWGLIAGEQIQLGGIPASIDLAERAEIGLGAEGVDLCCRRGLGMRFLVRFRNVRWMTGVDASETAVTHGRDCCEAEGLAERIRFVLGDVCDSGLPDASADFVWGEDAWCHVPDKRRLIAEATRIIRPGGTIAFTDWVGGLSPWGMRRPTGISDS